MTRLSRVPCHVLLLFLCPHNPVYARRLDPSVLAFSLSLYRHPIICILYNSRFTSYTKQTRDVHYKHTVFSSYLKSKVVNILTKTSALFITLNIDDTPVVSRSHYVRRVDPSSLGFSLTSHRHSSISLLFSSLYRFIINKNC